MPCYHFRKSTKCLYHYKKKKKKSDTKTSTTYSPLTWDGVLVMVGYISCEERVCSWCYFYHYFKKKIVLIKISPLGTYTVIHVIASNIIKTAE
jgi:hypothetical protein